MKVKGREGGSESGNSIGQPPLEGEEGDGGEGRRSIDDDGIGVRTGSVAGCLSISLSDTHTYTHRKNLDACLPAFLLSFLSSVVHGQLPTLPLSARPSNSTSLGSLGPRRFRCPAQYAAFGAACIRSICCELPAML